MTVHDAKESMLVWINKQLTVTSWLTSLFLLHENEMKRLDNQYHSIDDLYVKPYTRAAQYITGLWAGYYLSKINRQFGVRKVSVKAIDSLQCSNNDVFFFFF